MDRPRTGVGGEAGGVRYITEDMIRKIAKEERLELITILNLTLSKEGGKKIKYIENLDKLKRLTSLSLSYNLIEKVEKLEKLTALRELNLSHNRLTRIENLETLTSLQLLDVTGNQIESIPVWLPKKLKTLRVFRIAQNEIQSLGEVQKLRILKDLTSVTLADNPVAKLSHCRAYVIFHMVTLESLDRHRVTVQERHQANQRFNQEELENLMRQLEETEKRCKQLEDGHNRSLNEIEEREKAVKSKEQKLKDAQKKIKDMSKELETKSDLLKRKTAELTRACAKHYELEQELAFYKIDHKFETLSKPKAMSTDEESVFEDDEGLVGESPYLGKGRFKKAEKIKRGQSPHAKGSPIRHGTVPPASHGVLSQLAPAPRQAASYQEGVATTTQAAGDMANGSLIENDLNLRKSELHELESQLTEKQQELQKGASQLQTLQSELAQTQQQIAMANQELARQNEAVILANQSAAMAATERSQSHLTEDDKQHLRDKLNLKLDKVGGLRTEVDHVEQELAGVQHDIAQEQKQLGRLREQARHIGSTDSLLRDLENEMDEREERLTGARQVRSDLEHDLQHLLGSIALETGDMTKLQDQLQQGQAPVDGALRQELESVVAGLQRYLGEVEQRADSQRQELEQLATDRQELILRIGELEQSSVAAKRQRRELLDMSQRVQELEESLNKERDANDALLRQMDESSDFTTDKTADVTLQLQQAEDEIDRLREALREADSELQKQDDEFHRALDEQEKKQTNLKRRVKAGDRKDDEIALLQKHFSELQRANTKLQDQVWGMEQEMTNRPSNVDPAALRNRLRDVMHALRTGKGGVEPEHSEDEVGGVLRDLQEDVEQEMERAHAQKDRALRERDQAENEVRHLKDAITQAQEEEREYAERAIQTLLDDQKRETDRLRAQLARLQEELDRERSENQDRAVPVQYLQPSTKASSRTSSSETGTTVYSASSVEGDSDARSHSPVPSSYAHEGEEQGSSGNQPSSSDWSKKRRVLYETMTPDEQALFDELQQEIDFLKQLLAKKDRHAAEKAIQAIDAKTQQLLEMVEKRSRGVGGSSSQLRTSATSLDSRPQPHPHQQHPSQKHAPKHGAAGSNTVGVFGGEERGGRDKKRDQMVEKGSHHTSPASRAGQGYGSKGQGSGSRGHAGSEGHGLTRSRSKGRHRSESDRETRDGDRTSRKRFPSPADPQLAATERELQRAEREFESIQGVLAARTKQLRASDRGTASHSAADKELDDLYSILEDQKSEILRLNDVIDRLEDPRGANERAYETEVRDLVSAADDLRNALRQQRSRVERYSHSPSRSGRGASHSRSPPRTRPRSRSRSRPRSRSDQRSRSRPRSRSRSRGHRHDTSFSDYGDDPHYPPAERVRHRSRRDGFKPETSHPAVSHVFRPGLDGQSVMYGSDGRPLPPGYHDVMQGSGVAPVAYQNGPGVWPGPHGPMGTMVNGPVGLGGIQAHPSSLHPSQIQQQQPQSQQHLALPNMQSLPNQTMAAPRFQSSQQPVMMGAQPQSAPGGFLGNAGHNVPNIGPQGMVQQMSQPVIDGHFGSGMTFPVSGAPAAHGQAMTSHGQQMTSHGQPITSHGQPMASHGHPMTSHGQVSGMPGQTGGHHGSGHFSGPSTPRGQIRGRGQEVISGLMNADGQIFVPDGHGDIDLNDAVILPLSPVRPQRSRSTGDLHFSAHSTPVAGGPGTAGLTACYTPNGSFIQPSMMSTPLKGERGRKGILKKACSEEEDLHCNVPQHHDLEDYVEKLQEKIRRLKQKQRDTPQRAPESEGRRVLFEDEEASIIERLQSELEARRDELEGLDLAIEGQKQSMRKMHDTERRLLTQREAARKELHRLKHGRQRRRDYLSNDLDLDPVDSDYDYEFPVRSGGTRRDYLLGEIDCLEETLARRRAELREADRLLAETEADLAEARKEAVDTIRQYDTARDGYKATLADAAELEQRADTAGRCLLETQSRLGSVEGEFAELRQARIEQQAMLQELTKLVSGKDEEFTGLSSRITDAQARLDELRAELLVTESRQSESQDSLKDTDKVITERRRHISSLNKQLEEARENVARLGAEADDKRACVEQLEQAVAKRREQLRSLGNQLDGEIARRQSQLEAITGELDVLRERREECERQLWDRQDQLAQMAESLSQEADTLASQRQAAEQTTNQLHSTHSQLQLKQAKLTAVSSQLEEQLSELQLHRDQLQTVREQTDQLAKSQQKEEKELQKLRKETAKISAEAREVEAQAARERRSLSELVQQRDSLQSEVGRLRAERQRVAAETQHLTAQLQDTRRVHSELGSLEHLEQELGRVEGWLSGSEAGSQPDIFNLPVSDPGAAGLNMAERVRQLGRELVAKERDKLELADALKRSYGEVQALRRQVASHVTDHVGTESSNQEVQRIKEQAQQQMAELEASAHAHASRAHRLADELSYVRAQLLETSRQLDSRKQLEERDAELGEQLRALKSDLAAEFKGGVRNGEHTDNDDVSQKEREQIKEKLDTLKNSLTQIRSQEEPPVHQHNTVQSFAEQQQMLKQQLQLRMSRQAESLSAHRHISQTQIQGLQDKLKDLEQALSRAEVRGLGQVDDILKAAREKLHSFTPERDTSVTTTSPNYVTSNQPVSSATSLGMTSYSNMASNTTAMTSYAAFSTKPTSVSSYPYLATSTVISYQNTTTANHPLTSYANVATSYPTVTSYANKVQDIGTSEPSPMTSEGIKSGWPKDKDRRYRRRSRSRSPNVNVNEIWETLTNGNAASSEVKQAKRNQIPGTPSQESASSSHATPSATHKAASSPELSASSKDKPASSNDKPASKNFESKDPKTSDKNRTTANTQQTQAHDAKSSASEISISSNSSLSKNKAITIEKGAAILSDQAKYPSTSAVVGRVEVSTHNPPLKDTYQTKIGRDTVISAQNPGTFKLDPKYLGSSKAEVQKQDSGQQHPGNQSKDGRHGDDAVNSMVARILGASKDSGIMVESTTNLHELTNSSSSQESAKSSRSRESLSSASSVSHIPRPRKGFSPARYSQSRSRSNSRSTSRADSRSTTKDDSKSNSKVDN